MSRYLTGKKIDFRNSRTLCFQNIKTTRLWYEKSRVLSARTTKERKKLIKTISQVGVRNEGDHYAIMVPKELMGIPYEGDLYILPMLMHATPLKVYEKSYRSYAAFTQDEKGRYWLRITHDDSAYTDHANPSCRQRGNVCTGH